MSRDDTHNIHKSNIQNTTTSSSDASPVDKSDSGIIFDAQTDEILWQANLGKPMVARDRREFLLWCKFWIDNVSKAPDEPGKHRALMSIIKKGEFTMPKGYQGSVRTNLGKSYELVKRDIQSRSQEEIDASNKIRMECMKGIKLITQSFGERS